MIVREGTAALVPRKAHFFGMVGYDQDIPNSDGKIGGQANAMGVPAASSSSRTFWSASRKSAIRDDRTEVRMEDFESAWEKIQQSETPAKAEVSKTFA